MVMGVESVATPTSDGLMKIGQVLRTLGSGTALYFVMAACGASDRVGGPVGSDGGGASSDGADIIDALVDELGNPVKEAAAGPLPPDVATESCTKMVKYNGATDYYVAEHAYPGKLVADLTAVRVALTPTVVPVGTYTHQMTTTFLSDGVVGVLCTPVSAGASTWTVTFVLAR
jgi:hypothetical protein